MQDAFRAIPSKLRRTWKMPDAVDASGIRARLTNGELVITLPKAAKVCTASHSPCSLALLVLYQVLHVPNPDVVMTVLGSYQVASWPAQIESVHH